jgi:poly(3-hydroxybutyrate) depolymerase
MPARILYQLCVNLFCWFNVLFSLPGACTSVEELTQDASVYQKRAITFSDTITMTRLSGSEGIPAGSIPEGFALFSPDRHQFLLILRRGNLERDTNDFSMLLYKTEQIFKSPERNVIVQMSSSTNRNAIRHVRWLADNDTIVFLGENPGETSQVYEFHVQTQRLDKLTSHPTSVTSYDITEDGLSLVYEADPPSGATGADFDHKAMVVRGQGLFDLLMGRYGLDQGQQVFVQRWGHAPIDVPSVGEAYSVESAQVSPNGRFVLLEAAVRSVPAKWRAYQDKRLQEYFARVPLTGTLFYLSPRLYFVFDSLTAMLKPLVDAPSTLFTPGAPSVRWKLDSSSIFLQSYLPLDTSDSTERTDRENHYFKIEVRLPDLNVRKLSDDEWPEYRKTEKETGLQVVLEQTVNAPPRIYASDQQTKQRILLIDLNPKFKELDLGRVDVIEWKANGIPLIGGLYLPPDWTPNRKYPLVIQTHGFDRDEFSMDGLPEWGSAYAARLLAAKGIIVLQAFAFKNRDGDDHYNDDRRFGSTKEMAGRNINVSAIEGVINYLDNRRLIDRDRVGIVGFSRTVMVVTYLLTHSKHHFAAASLVDGVDGGYYQEIIYPHIAWDIQEIYGGATPFGEGLKTWLKDSPSFSLGNVSTPVRLFALNTGGILEQWEWYAGLALQKKPVDFTFILDEGSGNNHLLFKPWERRIAQQELVDWFCFWLKGEEDPLPAKSAQYARWRELRQREGMATPPPVPSGGMNSGPSL